MNQSINNSVSQYINKSIIRLVNQPID